LLNLEPNSLERWTKRGEKKEDGRMPRRELLKTTVGVNRESAIKEGGSRTTRAVYQKK